MDIRKKQKLIVLENKELIEAIAGEEAEFEGVNGSNVLEMYLLKGMITANESIGKHFLNFILIKYLTNAVLKQSGVL